MFKNKGEKIYEIKKEKGKIEGDTMKNGSFNYKRTMLLYGTISSIFIILVLLVSLWLKDFDLLYHILLTYALLSVLFVPYLIFVNSINTITLKALRRNCRIIQAEIVEVEALSSTRYIAKCHYRDDERTYTFYSETLTSNPKKDTKTAKVLVYIDKRNPSNYYVDIDSIYKY
jgi:hypothetical protein